MDDTGYYGLAAEPDEMVAKERAAALQAVLRRNQDASVLAALSGAKGLQPFAQMTGQSARQQEQLLAGAGESRLKMAMQKQQAAEAAKQRAFERQQDFDFRAEQGRLSREHSAGLARTRGAMGMGGGEMSDEAIDILAHQIGTTGTVPTARALQPHLPRILARTATLYPDFNAGSTKADFKADEAALTQLTKQRESTASFEKTALKNLDLFLGTLDKVVDTGSPLANKPLRYLSAEFAGNPQMSQFIASRQVAVQEIAKILSGSMGNQVVSDSARHEAQQLLSPDATLNQIRQAADILKQDMGNRMESFDIQIGEIRGRIKGRKATKAKAAATGATGVVVGGGAPAGEGRKVVRSGTNKKTGRKVVEYDDGTREEQ